MYDVLKIFAENTILEPSIINNISEYLSIARDIKDKDRNERIDRINKIIILLNGVTHDNSMFYYRQELYIRTGNKKYLNKYTDEEISSEKQELYDSICTDACVLLSHLGETTDKQFVEEFLPIFSGSNYYYESINSILLEYPMIFKNEKFYNRFICILNRNHENNKSISLNKEHKKLIKKIKKI